MLSRSHGHGNEALRRHTAIRIGKRDALRLYQLNSQNSEAPQDSRRREKTRVWQAKGCHGRKASQIIKGTSGTRERCVRTRSRKSRQRERAKRSSQNPRDPQHQQNPQDPDLTDLTRDTSTPPESQDPTDSRHPLPQNPNTRLPLPQNPNTRLPLPQNPHTRLPLPQNPDSQRDRHTHTHTRTKQQGLMSHQRRVGKLRWATQFPLFLG